MIPMPRGFNKPVANVRDDMEKQIKRMNELKEKKNDAPHPNNALEMRKRMESLKRFRRGLK